MLVIAQSQCSPFTLSSSSFQQFSWHITAHWRVYKYLKRMGGGGKIAPPTAFRLFKPNFVIRIWAVKISQFEYVHPGHFATILPPFWGPPDARVNSEPPGKVMDRQTVATFWRILTHFDIFDPLRVKISTLPPLCFMIYYIFYKSINYKKFKIL